MTDRATLSPSRCSAGTSTGAAPMADKIFTHHISPYHSVQGTEADILRLTGSLPGPPRPALGADPSPSTQGPGDDAQRLTITTTPPSTRPLE